MFHVDQIVTGSLRENCYTVADAGGDALIIDPGDDSERIAAHLTTRELDLLAVLVTHAHHDHIAAAVEVSESMGAPVHLHSADAPVLRRANFYRVLGQSEAPILIPSIDVDLAGREVLRFASMEVGVLHTPGHTPGSVCFSIGDDLFTGDTLFANDIGRTDLPEGDCELLAASLGLLAERYPATTVIRPGHGEPARLGDALTKLSPRPKLK